MCSTQSWLTSYQQQGCTYGIQNSLQQSRPIRYEHDWVELEQLKNQIEDSANNVWKTLKNKAKM